MPFTLPSRRRLAAGASSLAIALAGAACADTGDVGDAGQTEPQETETATGTDTAPATATGAAEGTTTLDLDAEAEETLTGRVGATFSANVFALTGSDQEGQVLVIHDGSVDVNTADTVEVAGELHAVGDPEVTEALGEDAETFTSGYEEGTVVLAASVEKTEG